MCENGLPPHDLVFIIWFLTKAAKHGAYHILRCTHVYVYKNVYTLPPTDFDWHLPCSCTIQHIPSAVPMHLTMVSVFCSCNTWGSSEVELCSTAASQWRCKAIVVQLSMPFLKWTKESLIWLWSLKGWSCQIWPWPRKRHWQPHRSSCIVSCRFECQNCK